MAFELFPSDAVSTLVLPLLLLLMVMFVIYDEVACNDDDYYRCALRMILTLRPLLRPLRTP